MKKMKSDNMDFLRSLARQRSFQILICVSFIYILFVTVEIPYVFISGLASVSQELPTLARPSQTQLQTGRDLHENQAPSRPHIAVSVNIADLAPSGTADPPRIVSGVNFDRVLGPVAAGYGPFPDLHKSAAAAWKVGRKLWQDLLSGNANAANPEMLDDVSELCPNSISLSGTNFTAQGRVMVLPCGLNLGSHVTVVGKPRGAHAEHDPKISLLREGDQSVMVSQFHMELQGLRTVEGEDPPRIFHFNPRLKGDWSGKPAIEQNTCYRMQWGTAMRCEGWKSKADEETVDGMLKCEKWIRDDDDRSEESKATWWLNRLIGKTRKVTVDWPYPFSEDKLFVMTISAGLEGYHVNVDGRHVTSFPYRTGFALEDATGLSLNGDVDVHSLFAASLPVVHPNYAPHRHLELSSRWKAPALSIQPVEMFIGILSAGNHFSERMAVRKSWLQHKLIASSNVVARFFVALHNRKEVNVELKKEAEFFGDIVIVPYLDNYDLVVLKTVAIFEYGVGGVFQDLGTNLIFAWPKNN
ncbi:hypothetical protein SAY86_005125 [Trapa natans]|uniref:Galectin domain-containing protein n=1 Tax=Trapa natans TaxID=22666 RepID=A0AAN7L8J9_TRANT|nr:hypothetical protein SAY86_005125 [Trapa natans]